MLFRHIYNQQLAQASYLVGCQATGEALVVDPNRDIAQYIELAEREGLRITAVTETHIHADFVSGARELAERTGAQLYLSDAGPAEWKYAFANEAGAILLRDGDSFMVGNVRIDAQYTPGHTPEHLSFMVTDTANADAPMGIFTGDFVFVGDVGRPDLLEKAAGIAGSTEQAARALFRSIQQFRQLPDYVQVWPGHGAGSACGRALGAVPQSTVGYERRFNWAFAITDEDQFVEAVLEGQPAPPPYFAEMKRVNKLGAQPVASLPAIAQLPHAQLADALEEGLLVVDVRPAAQFAHGHVPGTLNLPLDGAFLTWAGWLLPYDRPFALIADAEGAQQATELLRLIGLDTLSGYWTPAAIDAWARGGRMLAEIERRDARAARQIVERGAAAILDVRTPQEYAAGRIAGSQNIPLGELPRRLDEVPRDQPVLVHCEGGTRSAIAASVLSAAGWRSVIDLTGGFSDWQAAGNPVERGAAVQERAHAEALA
jgi:hydroxyacylglutathione hydrolase